MPGSTSSDVRWTVIPSSFCEGDSEALGSVGSVDPSTYVQWSRSRVARGRDAPVRSFAS